MYGPLVWASDSKSLFYVLNEPGTLRAFQLWRHTLVKKGTQPSQDVLVYHEPDEGLHCHVSKSRDGSTLLLRISAS